MAKVTVTYDNAVEAAIGTACVVKFGADAIDVLVTNWLAGHATTFKQRDIKTVFKAAEADETFNARIVQAVKDAEAINKLTEPEPVAPAPLPPVK